jgi:hypothetical protein
VHGFVEARRELCRCQLGWKREIRAGPWCRKFLRLMLSVDDPMLSCLQCSVMCCEWMERLMAVRKGVN